MHLKMSPFIRKIFERHHSKVPNPIHLPYSGIQPLQENFKGASIISLSRNKIDQVASLMTMPTVIDITTKLEMINIHAITTRVQLSIAIKNLPARLIQPISHIIFSNGFWSQGPDLDTILDEGSPNSTAGVFSEMALCNVLWIRSKADYSVLSYNRGERTDACNARPIMWTRTLSLQDIHGRPTFTKLDLRNDKAPLPLGLNVQQYSMRSCTNRDPMTIFQPPDEFQSRVFSE